ncbi:MAG: hypothetical protein NT166_07465 [Candidatus Aminicenantes bacterium]|nr:hypothetical protein [Candidatus Aminicenantes bacterium]
MSGEQPISTVDIICDLRQFQTDVDNIGTMQEIWQQLGDQIPGHQLLPGQPLTMHLQKGNLLLWVVDAHGLKQVEPDTPFRIIDLLRSPKLLYRCRVCDEYGPLRCTECEKAGRETRLCSAHAHTIKNELKAYCVEHIPRCECRSSCNEKATFRCRRCHKLYGDHVHRYHPHDNNVDYCQLCYRILFERCSHPDCRNLGRSKCAFQTREMKDPCGKPLCAEHSYQWKIWGAHNRGVTLCEHHKNSLRCTDPADLLFMMLIAKAPFVHRGKLHSLPNPFRLRRIINRNRMSGLSFDQISYAINSMGNQVSNWGRRAEGNYRFLSKTFNETTRGLSNTEETLLAQVKAIYQNASGWDAAQQITGLEITDRFFKPGQQPRYRVNLYLVSNANKGLLIGRGGSAIKQVSQSLNIEIDLRINP